MSNALVFWISKASVSLTMTGDATIMIDMLINVDCISKTHIDIPLEVLGKIGADIRRFAAFVLANF